MLSLSFVVAEAEIQEGFKQPKAHRCLLHFDLSIQLCTGAWTSMATLARMDKNAGWSAGQLADLDVEAFPV